MFTMFHCQDKRKNRKKVIDLSLRGHIFKIIRFQWNQAHINQTDVWFQKLKSMTRLQRQEIA